MYRRPSGIPKDDYDEAAGAETRLSVVPRFEQKYLEVCLCEQKVNRPQGTGLYIQCNISQYNTSIGATADTGATEDY